MAFSPADPRRFLGPVFRAALAAAALLGCGGGGGAAGKRTSTSIVFTQTDAKRDLDVVFVVDNSAAMTAAQTNLINSFPTFVAQLEAFGGGMPTLHLGVISSDMGAGVGTVGCVGNGDNGLFQATPRGTCTSSPIQNGERFLSNVDGLANYSGSLADAFGCIAALGGTGCGFQQPLFAVTHALGGDAFDSHDGKPKPPTENQGFLRDDAYLAIVLLTDADDCSAPEGAASEIFPHQGDGSGLSTTLGPPTRYRCNEFGHLCGSPPAPPPRRSPTPSDLSTVAPLAGCTSNETGDKLIPISALTNVFKALKGNPTNQILVAAITGLYDDTLAPYAVTWKTPAASDTGPWPQVVHSCTSAAGGTLGDPAVRIGEWVHSFEKSEGPESICETSFQPALQRIGTEIRRMMSPACITGRIAQDPSTGTYDCTATDRVAGDEKAIPSCATSPSSRPCWHLDTNADCVVPAAAAPGTVSLRLVVDRDGAADASTTLNCLLCQPGEVSAGCPG